MSTPWLQDAATSPGPWGSAQWQYSGNAGASWVAYNGGNLPQVAGPKGTQRFRAQFTIPAGSSGSWKFTAQGDLFQSGLVGDWDIVYDGVVVGTFFGYAFGTVTLNAVPGAHTVEVRVGQSTNAGQTQLRNVSSVYPATVQTPVSCDCCAGDAAIMCYSSGDPVTELLANGAFNDSSGMGVGSSVGPGWTQDAGYAPCGPNIFGSPCSAGSWSYFTTNAGQVAAGGQATLVARGGRSMAINVSNVPTAAFMRWNNVNLVQGYRYRFKAAAGIIYGPFAVALYINNVRVQALTPPPVAGQWAITDVVFVWNGTTGPHSISVNSDSTVFGGNDHVFDDFSLQVFPDRRAFMMVCDGVEQWFDVETGEQLTAAQRETLRDCGHS